MNEVTIYSVALGLSVFALTLYFYSTYRDYLAERLQAAREAGQPAGSFFFRILKPFARFFGHLVSALFGALRDISTAGPVNSYLLWVRMKLQGTLISAGNPEGLTADEFIGLVVFSTLSWTLLGVVLGTALGWSVLVLAGFALGIAHPLLWLRKKVHQRKNEIRRLLPYALDLLTLSVEAGLDFVSALDRISQKLSGTALGAEFSEVLRTIRLGESRAAALRGLADRTDMPEVISFTSALVQADELGASVDQVLRVQAEQIRNDRYNRAEKKAMEAPVKILFPLIAFIFPTVFIILFAPIGITYLSRLLAG